MKRNHVKHLISFAAAMTLCTAIFVGTPSDGMSIPGESDGRITILEEKAQNPPQEEESGQEKGQEPGIAPQSDMDLNKNYNQ